MFNENNEFAKRITQLRMQRSVSARDMSLSIGQNPGYIHNIESGKALPSMTCFFYICEYFQISPKDFFDDEMCVPKKCEELIETVKHFDSKKICLLNELADYMK